MSERQQKGGARAAEVGGVFEVQDAHTQLKLPGISVSRQERGKKNATHWSFIVFRAFRTGVALVELLNGHILSVRWGVQKWPVAHICAVTTVARERG